MTGFVDAPGESGVRVWRRGSGGAVLDGVALILIGGMAAAFSVAALWLAATPADRGMALVFAVVALFHWGMAAYLRRDRQGKAGGRIALSDAGIELDLPANRSLIHRPPACRGHYPWSAITGLLTREEAYGAQGMALLQRPYWLTTNSGAPILLFEERALTTGMQNRSLGAAADEIARRGGVTVTELPIAQGRGGVLGVWFARPPALDAAPLDDAAQYRLIRRVRLTGILAGAAIAVVGLARLLG